MTSKITKFLINPFDISYFCLLYYCVDDNPDNDAEIKNLTLSNALDMIEECRNDWTRWEIWANDNSKNQEYKCVAVSEIK
ncbi:MAG: hypothetical protein AABY22_11260 [Nanoarchaeota archaeon]